MFCPIYISNIIVASLINNQSHCEDIKRTKPEKFSYVSHNWATRLSLAAASFVKVTKKSPTSLRMSLRYNLPKT